MKIICIGRNYMEHARELNNPLPQEPVFFMKPDTSLIIRNRPFFYPDFTSDLHYEGELVLKICKNGRHIVEKFAHTYYDKVGFGIDFTARDLQQQQKQKGLPWEIAKAFDGAAPIGTFLPVDSFEDVNNIPFRLILNGETVQDGNSSLMIFSFDKIISYISRFVSLKMGDLIFTGTPAGVGPVKIGDTLEGYIGEQQMLRCMIK
ncbi:MAG TPA: fumarylacetoacetate hydrolase family protein [Bacteroidales bacterium]|nr:fumarylacetoacetate hydrolase family protein [Bacteroidales bacterium]